MLDQLSATALDELSDLRATEYLPDDEDRPPQCGGPGTCLCCIGGSGCTAAVGALEDQVAHHRAA